VELRVPVDRKARWEEAARRSRTDLSGWARRQLDEAADALLGREDAEPGPPTRDQIRVSLEALGAMGPERSVASPALFPFSNGPRRIETQ
jgi:hypothetical protein